MLTRLVAVLLAFVPGGLLGFVFPPGRNRWAVWASAPILSLGLTSIGVTWLPTLGLPNGTTAVLVTELAVAAATVGTARLLARRGAGGAMSAGSSGATASADARAGALTAGRWGLPPLLDLIAVAVPAVICLGFGRAMLHRFRFPTGWDAQNHAILTGNILQTGSTAITAACSTGSTLRVVACKFYPVAVDVSWAQAASLSGGPVSVAMTTWSMVVGPLSLVAAVYALVRWMGGRPVVAGCAAAAPAVLGPLWEQQLLGRVTGALPAFGIMIGLLFVLAVKGRAPVRFGLLAGLASAGLVMAHTYDILFAATFALAMLVTLRGRYRIRTAAWAVGTAAASAVLTVAPVALNIIGAGGERASRHPIFEHDLGASLHYWVIDLRRYALYGYPVPGSIHPLPDGAALRIALGVTVICMLAAPLCFAYEQLRWGRPWVILWVAWTLIGVWTTTSTSGPAADLAALWYGDVQRLRDMIFIVYPMLAVAGACAIGTCVQRVAARLPAGRAARRWLTAPAVPSVATLLLVVPLLGLGAVPATSFETRALLARETPNGAAYPRIYAWLAKHTPKGDVVAYNRNVEFFAYSFSDYGVSPLFGITALLPANRQNELNRYLVWDWLADNGYSPTPQGCLVRQLRVRYVVVSTQRMPNYYTGQYRHPTIGASPYLDLVHRDGPIRVFAVNDRGRACPGSA